ncbi:eukaryotic translation initiation factor 3 subunit H-like [Diaphorina citri]|uniref:Eukaryotic translation initiation factor 3 subunit H-like n=1 Tax=Diaphorina citri TaxID=121845 RepID=A0A1S3DV01_DIACI|nr:eukaryotic translation initiation factor 3 subunit H-like [Diaphorina citri]
MATSRVSRVQIDESPISYVQMDGLAVMKIVKHCHEESTNNIEVAQGALLGLVVDNRLEITNCFPFPKNYDESVDEGNVIPQLKVTERDEEKDGIPGQSLSMIRVQQIEIINLATKA